MNKKNTCLVISVITSLLLFSLAPTCSMCGIKIADYSSDVEASESLANENKTEISIAPKTDFENKNEQPEKKEDPAEKQEKNTNSDPLINSVNVPSPITANTNYQISANADDPDGDNLTYEWNVSDGIIIDITDNILTWMSPVTAGEYTLELKVTDGNGGEARELIKVTVIATAWIKYGAYENECGYIYIDRHTHTSVVDNGSIVYTGDTENGSWVKGYISFEIPGFVSSTKIKSAELSLKINIIRNNPSFFNKVWLCQANNWGANPLKAEDFNRNNGYLQEFSASGDGNIVCSNEGLVQYIQENTDNNSGRAQFVIMFYPVSESDPGLNNGTSDGWLYFSYDMSLDVEYYQ